MEINTNDLLYFENPKLSENHGDSREIQWNREWKDVIEESQNEWLFEKQKYEIFDFRETIGISFKVNSPHIYGLPERADRTKL